MTCTQNRHRLKKLLSEDLAADECPQTLSPSLVEELKQTAHSQKYVANFLKYSYTKYSSTVFVFKKEKLKKSARSRVYVRRVHPF